MTTLAPMPTPEPMPKPLRARVATCGDGLPSVEVEMTAERVLERLGEASRRGRLPGSAARPGSGALFRVAAFGHPVDADLEAMASGDGLLRLDFRLVLPRRLAGGLALGLAVTVWPGVYFMDQLMIQCWPAAAHAVPTWWWYVPLAVLPIPWVWRGVMRRARETTADSAREAIGKIAAELGAG